MADWISVVQVGLVGELSVLDASEPGGYLKRRESFQGCDLAELMAILELSTPGVVVAFRDGSISGGPFLKRDDTTFRYRLWCVALNLRRRTAGTQGDAVQNIPGAYEIAQDVIRVLRRKRLTVGGKESLGITFTGLEWIERAEGVAVMQLDCEVTLPQIDWAEV